tara:strand:+ start:422 stop:1573 length:1152 start_codon:yes stop_codon:yes gene_type:complete
MKKIYLDNQSTTPIDPLVFAEMEPWFKEKFGNAASRNHTFGWEADHAVEGARKSIADLIYCKPSEIIFTSGATESNNIAIQGIAYKLENKGKHLITASTEHKAVLDIYEHLKSKGYEITILQVKDNGLLDINKLLESIRKDTILVSIMHVNNEIGVIQPIEKIGAICKSKGIVFHVDAAQSVGKIPLEVDKMNVDLLSISSHKMYGPKGVGALYIRKKNPQVVLSPIMFGGGHEKKYRSGTLNVPCIVGFGKASEICSNVMDREYRSTEKLRNILLENITSISNNIFVNGSMSNRIAGNLNLRFAGISNEALIAGVPEIAISTGSACTTSIIEPSHVLLSIGLSRKDAYSSIRFGIGRFNTKEEINIASLAIQKCLNRINNLN